MRATWRPARSTTLASGDSNPTGHSSIRQSAVMAGTARGSTSRPGAGLYPADQFEVDAPFDEYAFAPEYLLAAIDIVVEVRGKST